MGRPVRRHCHGRLVADGDGLCGCPAGSAAIEDACVPVFVVAGAVLVPLAAAAALLYAVWRQTRVLAVDAAWRVELRDLAFDEPLAVLGRGAFGAVLRGQVPLAGRAWRDRLWVVIFKAPSITRRALFASRGGRRGYGAAADRAPCERRSALSFPSSRFRPLTFGC